ncbi:hypothetical protein Hanom_Chr04g00346511 [Helianthus anomalus]
MPPLLTHTYTYNTHTHTYIYIYEAHPPHPRYIPFSPSPILTPAYVDAYVAEHPLRTTLLHTP